MIPLTQLGLAQPYCVYSRDLPHSQSLRVALNRLIHTINDSLCRVTAINVVTVTVLATFFAVFVASVILCLTSLPAIAINANPNQF